MDSPHVSPDRIGHSHGLAPAERSAPPRLRIHHFMLWTAMTAVWLAYIRLLRGPGRASDYLVLEANQLFAGVRMGLVTSVFGLGLWWKTKRFAYFNQPGQWVIAWQMLSILYGVGIALSGEFFSFNVWSEWPILVHPWSRAIVNAAVLILFAWRVADTRLWRSLFGLSAVLQLWPIALGPLGVLPLPMSPTLIWSGLLLSTIPLLLMAAIVVSEQRRGRELARHWSHLAGLLCWLATAGMSLGTSTWFLVFRPQL